MKLRRLTDIAITARDLDAAVAAWRASSALAPGQMDAGQRALLTVGDLTITLVSALPDESDGMRSLTLSLDSLEDAVRDLRARGVKVGEVAVDEDGRRSANIDPESTHGVPIRIVEEQE